MRVVFMGTPNFASKILESLLKSDTCEVVAVYTQPDRPKGRGKKISISAVKELATEKSLPIFQVENFKQEEDVLQLKAHNADLFVVVAYGLLLPQQVLDIPKLFPLNIHASLLPHYRGAAPIERCILNGDNTTGISIMKMEKGLDSGPIMLQRALRIAENDTSGQIYEELALLGSDLILEAIERIKKGTCALTEQNEDGVTYASKLTKEDGFIDWTKDIDDIHNRIRAMSPRPGAHFFWKNAKGEDIRLTLASGERIERETQEIAGTILGVEDHKLLIACKGGVYLSPQVKPEGRSFMSPKDFVCGYLRS